MIGSHFIPILLFAVPAFHATAADGPAGADQNICGTSALMQADPLGVGQSGTWVVAGGSGTFSDTHSPFSQVTNLAVGENVFNWILIDNGVPSSDEVIITVYDQGLVAANAGPDSVLCSPDNSLFMQASPVAFPALGSWFVVNGAANISSFSDANASVTIPSVGSALLQWTVYNGPCGSTFDEVTISLQECVIGVEEHSDEPLAFEYDAATRRLMVLCPLIDLRVMEMGGRVIMHITRAGAGAIDLSHLAPGAYVVSADGAISTRVVIHR